MSGRVGFPGLSTEGIKLDFCFSSVTLNVTEETKFKRDRCSMHNGITVLSQRNIQKPRNVNR